jgi:hypothetical protein
MQEVEFNGHKYASDGEKVWKDGELLDIQIKGQVKRIEQVYVLKIDDNIYYGGEFYKKIK